MSRHSEGHFQSYRCYFVAHGSRQFINRSWSMLPTSAFCWTQNKKKSPGTRPGERVGHPTSRRNKIKCHVNSSFKTLICLLSREGCPLPSFLLKSYIRISQFGVLRFQEAIVNGSYPCSRVLRVYHPYPRGLDILEPLHQDQLENFSGSCHFMPHSTVSFIHYLFSLTLHSI